MEGLKIALVSDWYLPRIGGVELHLSELASELKKRGHEPHIITTTRCSRDFRDIHTTHRIKSLMLPRIGVTVDPRHIKALRTIFHNERFDIINAHGASSPLALTAITQGHRLGIPTVLTNHSLVGKSSITMLAARILNALFGETLDICVGVCQAAADDLKRISGRSDVITLNNGIDLTRWNVSRSTSSNTINVASVMRLSKRKMPLNLIRAIPSILDGMPKNKQVRFLIVGDGPLRSRCEREVSRLGISNHVQFLGHQSHDQIKLVFAESDIFALPSALEACPLSILEACSAGMPVVAMNGGGVGDVITHGKHGFLANSVQSFSHHIRALIRDTELRCRMATSAKNDVERFSWSHAIEQTLNIYALAREYRLCRREGNYERVHDSGSGTGLSPLPDESPRY